MMTRAWVIAVVMMTACADPEPLPEAQILPCLEWRSMTVAEPDIEVLVEYAPFYGPDCYGAGDDLTTWCPARSWDGHLGAYGRTVDQTNECTWLYAIDERTPTER